MDEAMTLTAVHALEAALRGAPLFLVVILLTRRFRTRPAAVRHALWCAALIGQAALLLGPTVIRDVPVTGLPNWTSPLQHLGEPTMMVQAPSRGSVAPSSPAALVRPHERLSGSPSPPGNPGPMAWWVGMGIALLVLARGRARRLVWERAASAAPPDLADLTNRTASMLGIRRRVRVLIGAGWRTPVTWGVLRPVVVFPTDVGGWPRERTRAVLLHELSHVRRLDALSRGLSELLSVLLWFNPLVWIAGRAMRDAAEAACDDAVVTAGLRPSRYVGHLVEIARGAAAPPPASSHAAVRRGSLERRAVAILDPCARRANPSPTAALIAGALAVVVALPLSAIVAGADEMPAEGDPNCSYTGGRHVDVVRAGVWVVEWGGDHCSVEVRATGEVAFAGDLSDVADVGSGGWLSINVVQPDATRSLLVTHTERRWSMNGSDAEFDAQAEEWLGAFLIELERHTGFAVDARLPRLLDAGGPDLVIAEASRTEGGHAGGVYLRRLIETENLDAVQVARVLAVAADVVFVDAVMTDLLSAVRARHDIALEPVATAYSAAAGTLRARAARAEAFANAR